MLQSSIEREIKVSHNSWDELCHFEHRNVSADACTRTKTKLDEHESTTYDDTTRGTLTGIQ